MTEVIDTKQVPQSLTFEALGYLANHPLATEPNESHRLETYADEITTNIIKDASKAAAQNHDENMVNTNGLNLPPTSKEIQSEHTIPPLDTSEYSTSNNIHDDNDFDAEDIQKKMNGVIHDIQSQSGDNTYNSRKSVTSNHSYNDQVNNSTPAITDPSIQMNPASNNSTEAPRRSMSESVLADHHKSTEQPLTLPVRQDESLSDTDDLYGIRTAPTNTTAPIDDSIDQHRSDQENHVKNPSDDDDFFNTKTATIDDDQRPLSAIKQNGLDETTRFGTTSPARVQSAASKKSVHVTPDEPATSDDDKRAHTSPSQSAHDVDNDIDRDNQEVATVARRPSRAMSPFNRPRSPTPNDSRKPSTTIEPSSTFPTEQSQSPSHLMKDDDRIHLPIDDNRTISPSLNSNKNNELHSPVPSDDNQINEEQQKHIFEPPTATISPASRRESTNKNDQQQTSRPTSAIKPKSDDNSFEPSTDRPTSSHTNHFIPTDEQTKRIKSGEKLQIPADEFDNERLNSPPPSPSGVKSMALINPLVGSSLVQEEQDHTQLLNEMDRKSPTASTISNEKVIDGDVLPSKSRRESNISQQQINNIDQKPLSRRESQVIEQAPQISSSRRASTAQQQDEVESHQESFVPEQQTSSRRESVVLEQKPPSRKGSVALEQQVPSKRASFAAEEQQTFDRRKSITDEQKPVSRKESTVSEQQPSSRRASIAPEQQPSSRRESIAPEQQPSSRRASIAPEQQPSSRRASIAPEQPPSSRRESIAHEQQPSSRRESIALEQSPSSRRASIAPEQPPSSRRESITHEQQLSHRRESSAPEQQVSSRRDSLTDEPQVSSKRESAVFEQKSPSRKGSTASEQQAPSKRASIAPEQQPSSRRESIGLEQQPLSRKESTASGHQVPSKRTSIATEQQPSSRRESIGLEQQPSSRRESTALEQQPLSRKESTISAHEVPSKRASVAPEQQPSSRRESIGLEQQPLSRKESTASGHQAPSKRASIAPEQQPSSRSESSTFEQKPSSRKESMASEQQVPSKRESPVPGQQISSRRESHVSDQQISDRRQSVTDQQEQKSSSKPASRKTSLSGQQHVTKHEESQHQVSSSPRRSSIVNISPSQDSSRRNSSFKQDQQSIPVLFNKDSRRSSYKGVPSSDTDVPTQTTTKHKQERIPSIDKRKKSSSTIDENEKHRSPLQRHSGQQSRRHSNLNTDETVVTPIIMDSPRARQHNGKRTSVTDSDYEPVSTSKLPPVNSSFQQEKSRRSETLNKQQIPISNRLERNQVSSSHGTTPSEDERGSHWTKQIVVPSIHLTDDEIVSSREDQRRPSIHLTDDEIISPREDQPRPLSPNVEQIAERNQPPSPPIITSTAKKRSAADRQKRKGSNGMSRRSTSADSVTHIRLVDDKSLDSTSENNTDFDRYKRRHIKPKKKDVETNTDQIYDFQQQQQQQRPFFDEQELTPQKPLKATKPMSDHLHTIRRRASNKEQTLTTPDTLPDTDTSIVRRTVKQSKDPLKDKDPVNVNVTVVVKKFAGTNKDGTTRTTAEAFVEQSPQQYFEPVQHPPQILPPTSTMENKEISEEAQIERPKSTEQKRITPEETIDHHDRHTQSDTEQIISEKQKKRRRPKRISRTCQTYECVFRRMEREQYHELRATTNTEKNIQTRKSQLRPRKTSPKKNLPLYLSADSFRVEELLPKQHHQSRRNISKSSALARSLSPQGGKLLILRPTLPFHHTDAVNVQRICLQYAIDLIPNDNTSHSALPTHRNKLTVLKQSEQTNNLPMISGSSSSINVPMNKTNTKEKSASNKSEEYAHQRRNGGAF